ncbi:hypothetical protein [Haloferax sp. DFSO60]|uniref:hypothetical protein n=1 Tax=Haloferax sp. DFSO60 TaxID=3388652 RepID=UPI00397DD566
MPSDTLLKSIRRWLMVVVLFLALLVYLVASTTSGVYLDNLIVLLAGVVALSSGLLVIISFTRDYLVGPSPTDSSS